MGVYVIVLNEKVIDVVTDVEHDHRTNVGFTLTEEGARKIVNLKNAKLKELEFEGYYEYEEIKHIGEF